MLTLEHQKTDIGTSPDPPRKPLYKPSNEPTDRKPLNNRKTMDKTTIGQNAGILWHLLANNRLWKIEELQLAREDKVDFGHDGNNGHTTVCLLTEIYY